MESSRIHKIFKSSFILIFSRFLYFFIGFVSRRLIVQFVGEEILGLNSVYSSLLDFLNLAELGIGTAIEVRLFKPLVEHDKKAVDNILYLASKIYFVIGVVVLCAGLILTPLLQFIIKDSSFDLSYIRLAFLINFVGIAISYFMADKRLYFSANEELYKNTLCDYLVKVILTTTGLVILYLTKEYLYYVSCNAIVSFVSNLLICLLFYKQNGRIKSKKDARFQAEERKAAFQNLKQIVPQKLGVFIFNSTDSIIISSMIGVVSVGLYANYMLISNSALSIASVISTALVGSFGKMIKEGKTDKEIESYFMAYHRFNYLYATLASTGIFCLMSQFVVLWMGDSSFVLSTVMLSLIVSDLFIHCLYQPMSSLYTAYGLFKYDKYIVLISVGFNLGSSLLLGYFIGLPGIILGTLLSDLITYVGRNLIVYKKIYKERPIKYILHDLYLCCFSILVGLCCFWLNSYAQKLNNEIVAFIVGCLICLAVNFLYDLVFIRVTHLYERIGFMGKIMNFKKYPKWLKLSIKIIFCLPYAIYRMILFFNERRKDVLAKKQLLKIDNTKSSVIGHKIHVVFICQCQHIFDKNYYLIETMSHASNIQATLFILGEKDYNDVQEAKNSVFAKYNNNNVNKVFYDPLLNINSNQLQNLKPDIVFFSRPYNHLVPKCLSSKIVSTFSRTATTLYGYSLMTIGKVNLGRDFTRYLNVFFADSPYSYNYYNKHYKGKCYHSFLVGFPGIEYLIKSKNGFKGLNKFEQIKNKNGYKIIWTPRWTLDKEIGGSNYFRYANQLFSLLINNMAFSFVFRPHPMMYENFVNCGIVSIQYVEDCKNKFKESNNSVYDEDKEYLNTFYGSNCLIADISSIIPEYLLTGKPIIFCKNKGRNVINETMEEMEKICYVANDYDDIEKYLRLLQSGNDYLKEKREKFVFDFIQKHQNASKNIISELYKLSGIKKENE